MHKITFKDLAVMKGVCTLCGPVDLERKSQGKGRAPSYVCKAARANRSGPKYKYESVEGGVVRLSQKKRDAVLDEFEKKCGVCGRTDDLALDHCHQTGAWRGLLCRKCNVGIGMFDDDIEKLKAAVRYLTCIQGQFQIS